MSVHSCMNESYLLHAFTQHLPIALATCDQNDTSQQSPDQIQSLECTYYITYLLLIAINLGMLRVIRMTLVIEQVELPAKLLVCILKSNKSNINQSKSDIIQSKSDINSSKSDINQGKSQTKFRVQNSHVTIHTFTHRYQSWYMCVFTYECVISPTHIRMTMCVCAFMYQ